LRSEESFIARIELQSQKPTCPSAPSTDWMDGATRRMTHITIRQSLCLIQPAPKHFGATMVCMIWSLFWVTMTIRHYLVLEAQFFGT